jgi:hypothetical protein
VYIGEAMALIAAQSLRRVGDAVTIAWDNGQVAIVHRGDMREIERSPAEPTKVYGSGPTPMKQ